MNKTYVVNKNTYRVVVQMQRQGGGAKMFDRKKETKDNISLINNLHDHLINGILKIYQETKNPNINEMKADVFSLLLCLIGFRDGMLYESYYKDIDMIIDFVKETVKIYKLKNIMIKKSKDNLYYLIFDKKLKNLAKDAMDNYNSRAMGQLLGFTCSLESIDRIEDYLAQYYYIDGVEFYAQLCSYEDYETNKNKIAKQFNEFKKIGSIISKNVTMKVKKIIGARTLIKGVVGSSSNKTLIKYRDHYIDILRQLAESEDDYAATIHRLETIDSNEQVQKDDVLKIKIVLFNAVIAMYQIQTGKQLSNGMIEKMMYCMSK